MFIGISASSRYQPFCADFGPFNLGTTHQVSDVLEAALFAACARPDDEASSSGKREIIFYTSRSPTDVANAIFLVGAFLCLRLNASPEEAWEPFKGLDPNSLPAYRDATWVPSTFDLTIRECWSGLSRAVRAGVYDLRSFDKVTP